MLHEITKIGNHFRRTTGKVNGWNLRVRQPIDNSINCFASHDLFALRPGVHMTMHAGQIAKLAHVNLKNFRSRTTKRDRLLAQLVRETVHRKNSVATIAIRAFVSGVCRETVCDQLAAFAKPAFTKSSYPTLRGRTS